MRALVTLRSMSTAALQVWEQIQMLPKEEQEELRDRLIRDALAMQELDDIELIAMESAQRMAAMLDAEENEAQAR